MLPITALTIADAVPLPLADGNEPDGNAEKAAGASFVMGAEAYLRQKLGASQFLEISGWDGSANPDEQRAYTNVLTAGSLLAYAEALQGLNIRALPQGGMITSTGYTENRTDLMTFGDIVKLRDELRARAERLVADYPAPDAPEEFAPPIIRSRR